MEFVSSYRSGDISLIFSGEMYSAINFLIPLMYAIPDLPESDILGSSDLESFLKLEFATSR
jgi:hypothetical protein